MRRLAIVLFLCPCALASFPIGTFPTGTFPVGTFPFIPRSVSSQASSPNPSNGATGIRVRLRLFWFDGSTAASHDVYLGTSSASVTAATTASPEFKGNQSSSFYIPSRLAANTTYYWRIDEKNESGTTKGATWSFTTLGPTLLGGTSE